MTRTRRLFAYRFIPDHGRIEQHTREQIAMLDLLGVGNYEKATQLMRDHLPWSAGAGELGR